MVIRVAINGFGRIGRQVLQAGINDPEIEWVAVNDLTDTHTLAHLLKYDSVFGVWQGTIDHTDDSIIVNGKKIKVLAEKDPLKLPWKALNIDLVVESTGFFTTNLTANQHIKAGAKKVVVSAPCKCELNAQGICDIPLFTIVKGVNEHLYDKNKYNIVSNASCTTNCSAPMVKVINDNYGIEKGFVVTAHAYTADQRLVDAPHKDLRRARAAAISIVPTTTGAAKAITEVIPELVGKLDGAAWRVPVPDGSYACVIAKVKKKVTVDEVNNLFSQVSQYHLTGVLEYSEEPLVSRDIIKNPHSCVFDSLSTYVVDGDLISVAGWYDNEWGYSNRMIDVIKIMFK